MRCIAGDDLPAFESKVSAVALRGRIEDRAVTLRTVKHVGRLFDDEGRVCGVVPLDIWRTAAVEDDAPTGGGGLESGAVGRTPA